MEQERKQYKLVRLLTGGVTPVVLAAAVLAFARLHDAAWEPGAQAAGICRELIAGTTEGRQALFGSCWVAPLPVLLYLPFAWLLPEPLAGWAAFFTAWLFLFWAVREAVKASGQSAWRIVLAQAAIAGLVAVARQPQALTVAAALAGGLMLLAVASLADWVAYRRLRDVVVTGAAGAFLMLCGFPFFGPAGWAVALLPLAACGHRETRVRFSVWLLLGGLPLVYALGVWLLMNRLILGDALFFLKSLQYLVPRLTVSVPVLLAQGLVALPALVAAWLVDARRERPGAGAAAATGVLVSFGVMLLVCAKVLGRFGLGWDTVALHVCALVLLLVALARLRQPVYRLAVTLALFVWLGAGWLEKGAEAGPPAGERERVRAEVEAYVNGRTAYGRVFVLGYAGLDLLRGYGGGRLVANMDLHIGSLRRAYKGQDLFLLVPRPQGHVRAESVFWKHPDIYELGGDRLLYAGTFGSWRLFQVVSAPTQEQLDEWRQAR